VILDPALQRSDVFTELTECKRRVGMVSLALGSMRLRETLPMKEFLQGGRAGLHERPQMQE
jgi:hypothetical protein